MKYKGILRIKIDYDDQPIINENVNQSNKKKLNKIFSDIKKKFQ